MPARGPFFPSSVNKAQEGGGHKKTSRTLKRERKNELVDTSAPTAETSRPIDHSSGHMSVFIPGRRPTHPLAKGDGGNPRHVSPKDGKEIHFDRSHHLDDTIGILPWRHY